MKIYDMLKIGEITSKDGDLFSVFFGIDEKHVSQLKKYSLDKSDTDLQNNTGDLARFGEGSYEKWFSKGRFPFSLIDNKTGALAAFAWLGKKPLGVRSIKFGQDRIVEPNGNWHTLAIRSYMPYRGKGITKNFANLILNYYINLFPDAKFWAGMDDRNLAVLNLMDSLGFEKKEDVSDLDSHWLIMTKVI